MPDMFEIYRKHADRYDELVRSEDYENNLGQFLQNLLDWNNIQVIEAGVGTGRVTKLYIEQVASAVCYDQSQHMLDYARQALFLYKPKLTFRKAENTDLPKLDRVFDVFIEGWSFGHTAMGCSTVEEVQRVTEVLISNAARNLKPGGTIIIMETLGTNTELPVPPHENLRKFYEELEQKHDFTSHVIRTDYRFPTNQEAAQVMGFFFGDSMEQSVINRANNIIPEWTGIWTKKI